MAGNARRGMIRLAAAVVAVAATAAAHAGEALRTEPVVVTATRIEEKVSEQASSATVVTRDAILLTEGGMAGDVLRAVPGVDVQRTGSAGNRENIKIRGGLATGTLVMIDGFPVNSPTLGQFDIGALPAARFDRVEVVRGAQSALYGSNAMSGVVNFLPPAPEADRKYGAGIAGGSFSTLRWNGFARGGGPPGAFHLEAGGLSSQGIHPNDDVSLVSFLGGGDVRLGDRNRIHALVLTTDADKGIPIDFGTPRDANHRAVRRGSLAGGRWEVRFSRSLSVTASGSVYNEFSKEKDPADSGEAFPFVFDDETKTRKVNLGMVAKVASGERSTSFAGVEFTRDRATDTLLSNFGDTHTEGTTVNRSVFLQEEWRPVKGTGVSAGVRVDRNSEAGTEVNPRLAVFHDIGGKGVRVRAAAGRGFRTPTISEKTDPFIGNRSLSTEVTRTYEAGTDLVLAGGDATLSAAWFFHSFRDLIQFDPSAPGPVGFGELRNAGKAFSRGVEATAFRRFCRPFAAELSYTYTETWDASKQRRILGVPAQRATASLLLSPVPALDGRVDWHVESDMLDAPPNGGDIRRAGYSRVDAFARYRWKTGAKDGPGVAFTGKVRNLLNRDHEERKGFPAPRIHFLLGAEVAI
ncbi:MAG: TonB-dependent receptor [Deltaproteobacteria bacterium]|nr:MAG: TonB-dependent receptor [Deltaproteobacteria bacterium]